MKILLFPHRSKPNRSGLSPLKIRITCGPGNVAEITTGKCIDASHWSVEWKRLSNASVDAKDINGYIVSAEYKLLLIHSDLERAGRPITANIVRDIFLSGQLEQCSLLQSLDIHNNLFKERLGQKGFSPETFKKYTVLRRKVEYFLELNYKRRDVFISELNRELIESFWHFLLTKGKEVRGEYKLPLDEESACGIIKRFKKVAKMGFRKQGISMNPFDDFRPKFRKEGKKPLELTDVAKVVNKDLPRRLNRVRDRFLVGCLTGMSDGDIQSSTWAMVITDSSGNKWIDRGRTKTGELCLIPLTQPVLDIIEKYKEEPEVKEGKYLFPRISNQKMNLYLEEISELCNVGRKITTHIARHTFGNSYINSGGTVEILARLMGHSDTRTTSIYAKRNLTTISKEANQVMETMIKNIESIKKRRT